MNMKNISLPGICIPLMALALCILPDLSSLMSQESGVRVNVWEQAVLDEWLVDPDEENELTPETPGIPWGRFVPRPISDRRLATEDSTPFLNTVAPAEAERGLPLPQRGQAALGTADWGAWIDVVPGTPSIHGAYAAQQVHSTLNLPAAPPDRTLYAPTLEASNYTPLESVTAYWRYSGMATTGRGWGCWDHPGIGGWAVFKYIDSTFLSNYTRNYRPGTFYFTETLTQDGETSVMLYNFNTGSWDIQYTSSMQAAWDYGWNIWETYFGQTCPPLPNIRSLLVSVYADGEWRRLTPDYGSPLSYPYCSSYEYFMKKPYYHWVVRGGLAGASVMDEAR